LQGDPGSVKINFDEHKGFYMGQTHRCTKYGFITGLRYLYPARLFSSIKPSGLCVLFKLYEDGFLSHF
jgi:hypothetical protein